MHPTAMQNGRAFLDTYLPAASTKEPLTVVDIGAQNVNGSLKELMRAPLEYVGVDFVAGNDVDVVLDDPYVLPFPDASADVVLSSSCFEHSEMFWVLFLEILRVLKPAGLFYLNVPSNGIFHRYPVDCWRFYPDSGNALVTWAKRNGYTPQLLESYTSLQVDDTWNDFIAVFVRDASSAARHPRRILHGKRDVYNGIISGGREFVNPSPRPEDQQKLFLVEGIVSNRIKMDLK
ncbi:MAG TPA: class I SAM-dependent methyltransferase [Burkholderiales bacterium]|nr:class I SAM-dependent methyltransferase [Burkholderiales bacterium]